MELVQPEKLAQGWAALPAEYRMPTVTPTLAEARAWCRWLAETHYENFHVASWFLPARLRTHFHSIYAYCRVSDDLGDEVGDAEQSRALLDFWETQLDRCYQAPSDDVEHPVFVALRATIEECGIPREPFADLLVAFRQDQVHVRFATFADVMDYCRYSANPVGRLVLYAGGYADAERFALSDRTCSALQLANFWQDVGEDFARGRVYLPREDMDRFGVDERVIAAGKATPAFLELMRHEVAVAREMFAQGLPLVDMVDRELAVDLDLFSRGGLAILRAIELQGYDVLRARPALSKRQKASLLVRATAATAFSRLAGQLSSGRRRSTA
jgi:squalene synthase HpnC